LFAPGLGEDAVNEVAHTRVFLEIGVDEFLGLALLDPDLLGKPKRGEPIDDAEVHGLGATAVFRVDHQWRHAKDLGRGQRVNVVAATEGLDKKRILREMGQ